MNRYASNILKGCVLDADLEYTKELCKLYNDYSLAPDKIEIREKKLSIYQLLIADFHNIPVSNVKKLVTNFFDKEKFVLHYKNLKLYLKLWLKP